jgi:hypothetical protein
VYAAHGAAQAGLTEGAERSSRFSPRNECGKTDQPEAAPRIGFKVLSGPDFLLACARMLSPRRETIAGRDPGKSGLGQDC